MEKKKMEVSFLVLYSYGLITRPEIQWCDKSILGCHFFLKSNGSLLGCPVFVWSIYNSKKLNSHSFNNYEEMEGGVGICAAWAENYFSK
jgi:hypothetical protein